MRGFRVKEEGCKVKMLATVNYTMWLCKQNVVIYPPLPLRTMVVNCECMWVK